MPVCCSAECCHGSRGRRAYIELKGPKPNCEQLKHEVVYMVHSSPAVIYAYRIIECRRFCRRAHVVFVVLHAWTMVACRPTVKRSKPPERRPDERPRGAAMNPNPRPRDRGPGLRVYSIFYTTFLGIRTRE